MHDIYDSILAPSSRGLIAMRANDDDDEERKWLRNQLFDWMPATAPIRQAPISLLRVKLATIDSRRMIDKEDVKSLKAIVRYDDDDYGVNHDGCRQADSRQEEMNG